VKKTNLKVTVITVCYNSQKFIEKTIDSVLAQKYENIEYLIIDGGSEDLTLSIIKKYANSSDKIKWLSEEDGGIYDAMNKGISLASGDIVGFLNSDDFYANDIVISTVVDNLNNSNHDLCYADLDYVSRDFPGVILRKWKSRSFEFGLFAKGWCPAHTTLFIKRQALLDLGFYDLSYSSGNDVEWMMRALEVHRFKSNYIPQVFIKMRMGGVSNSSIIGIYRQNLNIVRALKKYNLWIGYCSFFCNKFFSRFKQLVCG